MDTTGGNAFTNVNGEQVTIGNDAITRTFSIADGKLKTIGINNSRAETELIPEKGSEEFIISAPRRKTSVRGRSTRPVGPRLPIPRKRSERELATVWRSV